MRETIHELSNDVLDSLGRMGMATTEQLVRLHGTAESLDLGYARVRQALDHLVERRLVLHRPFQNHPHLWGLSRYGALRTRSLSAQCLLDEADGGWNPLLASNDLTIAQHFNGSVCWTHHDLERRPWPMQPFSNRLPNTISCVSSLATDGPQATWFQMENQWRNADEIELLVDWLVTCFPDGYAPQSTCYRFIQIARVVLVMTTPSAAALPRLVTNVLLQGYGHDETRRLLLDGPIQFAELREEDEGVFHPVEVREQDLVVKHGVIDTLRLAVK